MHYLEGAFPGCCLKVRCSSNTALTPRLICFVRRLHAKDPTPLP